MLSNLNIRIQNFKSYIDSGWINLEGKNVLVGVDTRGYSNGSGKSSIIDALALFLDDNWKNYNKTEVGTLTNINSPKKEYIIISLKCDIDGELFEAQITGRDGFSFNGNYHLLAKFQQEMSGAIMTQGLINNLADFEKRSQLDEYIDQFYNVKEVISKLKDFQKDTSLNFGKKIGSLNNLIEEYDSVIKNATSEYYTAKGQMTLYQDFLGEDIHSLELTISEHLQKLNSLNDDFSNKRNNLQNEKMSLTNRSAELKNVELIRQRLEREKQRKEEYIANEKTSFYAKATRTLKGIVTKYVETIQYSYGRDYNSELERKKKERIDKIRSIEERIQLLSLKTSDYILTDEELNEVNFVLKDWTPEPFRKGDTYGQVVDTLNRFVINVKNVIEGDSQEIINLRKELQEVPNVNYNKSAIVKKAEELVISADMLKYAPVNKPLYHIYYDYDEVKNEFIFTYNLPQDFPEFVFSLDHLISSMPVLFIDTTYFDSNIAKIEEELKVDTFEELERISSRIKVIDEELVNLSEREVLYQKELEKYYSVNARLEGAKKYVKLSTDLMLSQTVINENEEVKAKVVEEKDMFVLRQEDMNKLINNISQFSGEELRNEFGFKLAKLSSVLLNDIFNLEGEIMLESNGLRTVFKYNDGNGFLSFKVLSGGQLQKIKLSINLALLLFFHKDRQYIFLDEVFQHLDNPSKGLLINYIIKDLGIKNILLIQHDSLKFEGFKEIRVYRDEQKNTRVV